MENGIPDRAKLLFDRMPQLPTSIAAAYAQDGHVDGDPPPNAHKGLDMLVAMLGQAGRMEDALKIRQQMSKWNVFTWNAILSGYAGDIHSRGHCGEHSSSLDHAANEATLDGGVRIDPVSFITILSACSHLGKIQIARDQWSPMIARTKTLGSSQRAMSGDHRARERHFPVDLLQQHKYAFIDKCLPLDLHLFQEPGYLRCVFRCPKDVSYRHIPWDRPESYPEHSLTPRLCPTPSLAGLAPYLSAIKCHYPYFYENAMQRFLIC
ncbi:hypothetical protein SELMODRAFT_427318 [Selaginella moellendorffii]|uniref:Pentatricopeptide repeat-containing protein n=1 Tax=Selaginella moellendorffii TaxID=88036 RepID=D8SZK6_SELML|nr:hypothetical protein SELMODRAFT_427318 [Selaginella moellendorffii]